MISTTPLAMPGAISAARVEALARLAPVSSMEAFANLIDASSLGFGWRGVGVWRQSVMPARDLLLPPLATHHVIVLIAGEGEVAQTRPNGRHAARWRPGDFAFLPRATASGWRFRGEMTLVHIDLSAEFFRNVCLEVCSYDPNQVRFGPSFHAHDPELLTLANWLLREITDQALDGPIYAESIGVLVTVHILRAFLRKGARVSSEAGALSKGRLRRVLDYLAEHLVEPIPIEALAAQCNYSPYHFSRAFKLATGLPPRQYQIRLRTERARELLETTDLPIGEIAAIVGYEHQGQLARAFRKDIGMTPQAYRKDVARTQPLAALESED
jgi:AraC family transcriptional regulator